jgi:hypothetical protein
VLAAVGGVALLPVAGCTKDDEPVKPSTDDVIRAAAVERERALLALYAGATTPAALAVRADHEEHLAALTQQSTPSPVASPSAGPVPTKAALVAAERAAAAADAAAALDASPGLAALLASLAASEASHPVALA